MSLDGAITNLASWAGNVMMPTMAGGFFAAAVYRFSKGGQFEQLLYGGFASLMCSGMLRALEGFVQHAGPTSADGFWMATMSLVNWVANVILPVFALTQLAAMALHMGGVVSEIYPGSTWIRKFVAAIAALMVQEWCDWRSRWSRTRTASEELCMSLDLTPVHRNLHTKVTFLGLEFEDLILVLALAALMNLLAHFVSGNAHVFGMPLNIFMEFIVPV